MENGSKVKKVAQIAMLYVWSRQGSILEYEPSLELPSEPEIDAELMKNLSVSVWMESLFQACSLKNFLKNHFLRMTSSTWLFTEYVAYFCYLQVAVVENGYERFLKVLSIVTHFAVYCSHNGCRLSLGAFADIFCLFFEKELRTEFEKLGNWENLNAFLVNRPINKHHLKLMKTSKSSMELLKCLVRFQLKSNARNYFHNGIVLKDITQTRVETHEKAMNFTDLIANKFKNLGLRSLDELLVDFTRKKGEVEKLYDFRESYVSGLTSLARQIGSNDKKLHPEKVLEHFPDQTNSSKKPEEKKSKVPNSLESENKLQVTTEPTVISNSDLPSVVQKLIKDMIADINKLSDLVRSACLENNVKVV